MPDSLADRLLHGLGVSPGLGVGSVVRVGTFAGMANEVSAWRPPALSAHEALNALADELETRRAAATEDVAAEILGAHIMMARDPVLRDQIAALVEAGSSAEQAISESFSYFETMLAELGGYLGERASDVRGLCDLTLQLLRSGSLQKLSADVRPMVLVADDLSPADTATLNPHKVRAIVTGRGGSTGHTAILARALGIPAVVGCVQALEIPEGTTVAVDGSRGLVLVNPSERVTATVPNVLVPDNEESGPIGPTTTSDGHRVSLLINIGESLDLDHIATVHCDGVGLLRTEFLFLNEVVPPSIPDQEHFYRKLIEPYAGRRVVIRTLDAGSDKSLPFLNLRSEPNPALGIRGVRIRRVAPEVLENQLEAIRAAATGLDVDLWVMAPMIALPSEAQQFVERARAHGLKTIGVMVEVPSSVVQARELFQVVDFVSIGTNDLSQYTFAADRGSSELVDLLDPWQPALLRLVKQVVDAGDRAGKPVGVCGEAASDPLLAAVLVGIGISSLSVAAGMVREIRTEIGRHSFAECKRLARLATRSSDARTARERVRASAS